MIRTLCRLLVLVAVATGVVVAPVTQLHETAPVDVAEAADLSNFNPANIISDALFYDGDSMSTSAVQKFLNAKGASCVAGEMPCLKNYRQDTATQAADGLCDGYDGVRDETAAAIISKVGKSCSINPRVLLVLLQKEQSLVTGTRHSTTRYTKATGFACPDTAPCNPAFKGFVSQVYFAARQFQRYKEESWAPYKAFRTNTIQYHPRTACGTSQVYIKNYATAGLYSYTPYRPNAAALRAGYGEGDSCSAYGNRNFWLYYTDWFGSTQSPGGDAIVRFASSATWEPVLGDPLTWVKCGLADGGCYQRFENGSLYWSADTGVHVIEPTGAIRSKWVRSDKENGRLGYPISQEVCDRVDNGCYQRFQGGSIYWSAASGAHIIETNGEIRDKWVRADKETGRLGYPISDEACGQAEGGCYQRFQGGSLYWSDDSGVYVIETTGDIRDAWVAADKEDGPLGYPTSNQACDRVDSGCYQRFQGGSLYWSAASGAHVISTKGGIRDAWVAASKESGPLGYPLGNEECGLAEDGCAQQFQGGALYWSAATGAHVIATSGAVRDAWIASGEEDGPLGYPAGAEQCGLAGGGCKQDFGTGSLYWNGVDTFAVLDEVRDRYVSGGAESGTFGYPIMDTACDRVDDGCYQRFEDGSIYWSADSGAHVISSSGDIRDAWVAAGKERGALGYPTSSEVCGRADGGCYQRFEGGSLYWSAASGAHVISTTGAIRNKWVATGKEGGPLGYPIAKEVCGRTDGGCYQRFQGGSLYWSSATGAHAISPSGDIRDKWVASGKERGTVGYPTGAEKTGLTDGGASQTFRRGAIYDSSAGTFIVSGGILTYWKKAGAETGTLGYPIGDVVRTSTHEKQRFEGGQVIRNRSTGNTITR